jgi:hypothetical protein
MEKDWFLSHRWHKQLFPHFVFALRFFEIEQKEKQD